MRPHLEDSDLDHPISANELAVSHLKVQEMTSDLSVSLGQDVASPPRIDASDDSLPLSNLSNSPSPTTGRRLSLLSNTSINVPEPLTPTKRLFEEVVVSSTYNPPRTYQVF
jgi:hypothetical protein